MQRIKLSKFTLEKIKNGEFEKFIPEFYELKEIVENNPWHNNESVFNHTISVLEELEKLLERLNDRIKNYLSKKIKTYSKKELLFLSALFHDIGKKETFKKANNVTNCQQHEDVGSEKLKNIISRLDLSTNEKEIVSQMVKNHGVINNILDNPNESPDKKLEEFKRNNPNIFLEITLLTKADILGSQLKENKPEEFNFRINFLNKIISNY